MVNDESGIVVFEGDPEPIFVRRSSSSWAGIAPSQLVEAVTAVRRSSAPLSAIEQTAYELYSSSFSAVSSDARFVVLMMALETLIDPQPRDADVMAHVDALIEQTRQAKLPDSEIASLTGSLRYVTCAKSRSARAGRRLVQSLGPRRYMDLDPGKFFTECYTLRSRLVHGGHPRPTTQEIDAVAPALERLVSDLLAADVGEDEPEPPVEPEAP